MVQIGHDRVMTSPAGSAATVPDQSEVDDHPDGHYQHSAERGDSSKRGRGQAVAQGGGGQHE